LIVILDRQHSGKPQSLRDSGAWADLDLDGRADWTEQEAVMTLLYGHLYAAEALRGAGIDVYPISDGAYSERHKRANALAALYPGEVVVYVALHINAAAGQADYGSVFYDHRSGANAGPYLAGLVAEGLRRRCPELGTVNTIKAYPKRGHEGTDWTHRAYSTISGLSRPIGLCFEPFFVTSQKHRPLTTPEGLQRVGLGLAEGLAAYHRELSGVA
jgi:N-acetylmuramoyl-L-alanine amidase